MAREGPAACAWAEVAGDEEVLTNSVHPLPCPCLRCPFGRESSHDSAHFSRSHSVVWSVSRGLGCPGRCCDCPPAHAPHALPRHRHALSSPPHSLPRPWESATSLPQRVSSLPRHVDDTPCERSVIPSHRPLRPRWAPMSLQWQRPAGGRCEMTRRRHRGYLVAETGISTPVPTPRRRERRDQTA